MILKTLEILKTLTTLVVVQRFSKCHIPKDSVRLKSYKSNVITNAWRTCSFRSKTFLVHFCTVHHLHKDLAKCPVSTVVAHQVLNWLHSKQLTLSLACKLFTGFYQDRSAYSLLQRELRPLLCLSGEGLKKEASRGVVSKLFQEGIGGGTIRRQQEWDESIKYKENLTSCPCL